MAIMDTGFYHSIQQLMSDGSNALIGLGAGGGSLMTGYHALMMNLNDDVQAVAHHKASIKKVLVGSGIVLASGGLGKLLTSYFGSSTSTTGMLITNHAHVAIAMAMRVFGA